MSIVVRKCSRVNSFVLPNEFFQVTVNTNNVPTSKHSEYDYAQKCQTFLWKCQILPGNTRNMLGQKCMSLPSYIQILNIRANKLTNGWLKTISVQTKMPWMLTLMPTKLLRFVRNLLLLRRLLALKTYFNC